ncbi:hypothetical protein B0O80DRAFT_454021 [Mortierella sp. GBAus27b]|nr:hypothetical protein B0O80DRAFT_454021 [Mortierella sp. GBAus27b]
MLCYPAAEPSNGKWLAPAAWRSEGRLSLSSTSAQSVPNKHRSGQGRNKDTHSTQGNDEKSRGQGRNLCNDQVIGKEGGRRKQRGRNGLVPEGAQPRHKQVEAQGTKELQEWARGRTWTCNVSGQLVCVQSFNHSPHTHTAAQTVRETNAPSLLSLQHARPSPAAAHAALLPIPWRFPFLLSLLSFTLVHPLTHILFSPSNPQILQTSYPLTISPISLNYLLP